MDPGFGQWRTKFLSPFLLDCCHQTRAWSLAQPPNLGRIGRQRIEFDCVATGLVAWCCRLLPIFFVFLFVNDGLWTVRRSYHEMQQGRLYRRTMSSKDLANQQTHDGLAMHGQVGTITINPSALGWIKNLQSMPLLTQEGFQHKQT